MDDFAAELSRSCPLLESVDIQRDVLVEPGGDLRDALSEPQVSSILRSKNQTRVIIRAVSF